MVNMAEESKPPVKTDSASDTPTEPPQRQVPGVHVGPPSQDPELDTETHEALQMKVAMKMVGSAMVWMMRL